MDSIIVLIKSMSSREPANEIGRSFLCRRFDQVAPVLFRAMCGTGQNVGTKINCLSHWLVHENSYFQIICPVENVITRILLIIYFRKFLECLILYTGTSSVVHWYQIPQNLFSAKNFTKHIISLVVVSLQERRIMIFAFM